MTLILVTFKSRICFWWLVTQPLGGWIYVKIFVVLIFAILLYTLTLFGVRGAIMAWKTMKSFGISKGLELDRPPKILDFVPFSV